MRHWRSSTSSRWRAKRADLPISPRPYRRAGRCQRRRASSLAMSRRKRRAPERLEEGKTDPGGPMLVDSHCHLDFADFALEREAVIERARAAGIGTMVTICTRLDGFTGLRARAEEHGH